MSQAVLRPNLTKKFQWEVSQIADKERSLAPLYRVLQASSGKIISYSCRGGHKLRNEWSYIKIG